jgi:hypothetical protein
MTLSERELGLRVRGRSMRATGRPELEPNDTARVFSSDAPGIVRHLCITCGRRRPGDDRDPAYDLRLRVYYDGRQAPTIDLPLATAFGVLFDRDAYQIDSAAIGIEITNNTGRTIPVWYAHHHWQHRCLRVKHGSACWSYHGPDWFAAVSSRVMVAANSVAVAVLVQADQVVTPTVATGLLVQVGQGLLDRTQAAPDVSRVAYNQGAAVELDAGARIQLRAAEGDQFQTRGLLAVLFLQVDMGDLLAGALVTIVQLDLDVQRVVCDLDAGIPITEAGIAQARSEGIEDPGEVHVAVGPSDPEIVIGEIRQVVQPVWGGEGHAAAGIPVAEEHIRQAWPPR